MSDMQAEVHVGITWPVTEPLNNQTLFLTTLEMATPSDRLTQILEDL